MEWYWILILCWLSAGIGLLIGCMCQAAGRADTWAGYDLQKEKDSPIEQPAMIAIKLKATDEMGLDLGIEMAKAMMFIKNNIFDNKRFRWRNYYRAKKLCRNGKQISIGR